MHGGHWDSELRKNNTSLAMRCALLPDMRRMQAQLFHEQGKQDSVLVANDLVGTEKQASRRS